MTEVTLPSGVNEYGRYVHISQVTSGTTNLRCPYCNGLLTAKKGRRLAHHFAHTNETCIDVARKDFEALNLPLYDRFNIYIDAHAWSQLQRFHRGESYATHVLVNHDPQLIREGFDWDRTYQLTHEGKIPFGEATLNAFSEIQDGYVCGRHNQLSKVCQTAYFGIVHVRGDGYAIPPVLDQVPGNIADLNIYRSQVHRLYSLDLYLLQIEHDRGVLHKIGVTRDIDRRITEIEHDLKPLINVISIKVDRFCKGRGAVERYALHRYSIYHAEVGPLTEYFEFDKKALSNIRRDFTSLGDLQIPEHGDWWMPDYFTDSPNGGYGQKLGDYRVDGLIGQILAGEPAYIEQMIQGDIREKAHVEATKAGMERARKEGIHVGRPEGTTEDMDEFLSKYPRVIEYLQAGVSLRKTAKECSVSINTVRKVKDYMTP